MAFPGKGRLRPALRGLAWSALLVICVPGLSRADDNKPTLEDVKKQDWFLNNLYSRGRSLCYMRFDEKGWFVSNVSDLEELRRFLAPAAGAELVIPIFPSVYFPDIDDKVYYDAIAKSGIRRGDKVLVIGAGSGSDAWAAWLKSRADVYVVEINPMAVANIYATAVLAGFQVHAVLGDFTKTDLPKDFREFDYVLWNMPFVEEGDLEKTHHDGDDGTIMQGFLAALPSLVKKGGKAIVMNTKAAEKFISQPMTIIEGDDPDRVYVISNPD